MRTGQQHGAGARRTTYSHRAERVRRPLLDRVPLLAAAILLSAVVWALLVWSAISFGRHATSGASSDWWLLGLTTLGAMAAMVMIVLLGARLLEARRAPRAVARAPRVAGGKHHAR